MDGNKVAQILVVEDNPSVANLMIKAFERTKTLKQLHVVEDGVEAIAFLRQSEKYAQMPRPDIILLDLNLPRKNGHEVLAEIKSDPNLKLIPVIVCTTSESPDDIRKSYQLNANCYITVPVQLKQFMSIVEQICDFWLTAVKLPDLD
ncbi:MAG: response regulator [Hormoscilla sp.]